MSYVTTKDSVDIFYKDWGPKDARPIVFHHGWPLSSDDWDNQMLFFLQHGSTARRRSIRAIRTAR
jgi:non-heme chloroperoxidase